jgi:spermidine synthase
MVAIPSWKYEPSRIHAPPCRARDQGDKMLNVSRRAVSLARHALFGMAVAAGVLLGQHARADDPPKLIDSKESLYNNIYIYRKGDMVSLRFGFNTRLFTESVYDTLDDRDLPVPYTRTMTVGMMYAKTIGSILEIGSGGGRTSWYLHRFLPDVPIISVELDPVVRDMAFKYFGTREEPNYHVATRDGRLFLTESKDKYDIILIDAYRGPFVPFHLMTKEFYQLVESHLAAGGVVVQNVEPTTMLFDSAVKTIHAVFPQVEFYLNPGGAITTVAYDGDQRSLDALKQAADDRQAAYHLRYDLHEMLPNRRFLASAGEAIDVNAKLLTDDFAPVESLKAIERDNRKWPDATGPAQ